MSHILLERNDSIAIVTLSNPGKLNALSVAMWSELASVFHTLSQDESLRCVIVQGQGGNFAAGADIAEFTSQRNTAEQGINYHTNIVAPALESIAHCIHPTVAAIEGACVGGGLEIACACDLRIASASSRFGIPINQLGFALAPNEMQSLLQLVGLATTLEILLEGRVFKATEAIKKGLLHRKVDNVAADALQTAQRIAAGSPLAARMNKQLARRLTPLPEALTKQEFGDAYALLNSQDYKDGIDAFLSRRKPVFKGK